MLASVRSVLAMGVRPGDRVALWAPNSARWVIAALGILGAGAVLVPVNTRFKGQEAAYILDKSGSRALFVVTDFLDNDYVGMIRSAAPDSRSCGRAAWWCCPGRPNRTRSRGICFSPPGVPFRPVRPRR